jgi:hypothetical protein
MRIHRSTFLGVVSTLIFAASSAAADGTPTVPAERPASAAILLHADGYTTTSYSGYRVNFDDDPLQAGDLGPVGARIAIMPRASRATLIRPRTAFVAELLKSVEHL